MGARSRAAAQILTGQGFQSVTNFKGGIKAWKGHSVSGSETMGMTSLKGNERPAEIIRLAYAMEEALRQFYTSSAAATDDPDVSALLNQLADIETTHKDRLFNLFRSIEDAPPDKENVEADRVSHVMEGGFTVDDVNAQNRSGLQTTEGVLSLAMMVEAQAMDLYLRYADMRVDLEAKKILCQIADEEKSHLLSLGALIERKI